jgi:hypothetical protein
MIKDPRRDGEVFETEKGPVLLTGTPFSGTTWLGRQMADLGGLAYLHEPFNQSGAIGRIYGLRTSGHYPYLDNAALETARPGLQHLLNMRPPIFGYGNLGSLRRTRAMLGEWRRRIFDRARSVRPLWKDPMAVLSAGRLCHLVDASVVLVIRHPASFSASAEKRKATIAQDRIAIPGLQHLLDQPEFMDRYGDRFGRPLDELLRREHRRHIAAAWLWRILLTVALDELPEDPRRVCIVRYEDALARPADVLLEVIGQLGLSSSDDPQLVASRWREVHAHRSREQPFDAAAAREAAAYFSEQERAEIADVAGPIAVRFYSEDLPAESFRPSQSAA